MMWIETTIWPAAFADANPPRQCALEEFVLDPLERRGLIMLPGLRILPDHLRFAPAC